MTVGGVEAVFVTVTVPLVPVTTRIGATTRAVPAVRTVDDEAVVEDAVADVVADCDRRRLPSGGFAARVGLGVTDDVSVGVRTVVPARVAAEFVVVAIAAVVGVNVVLVSVGVAVIAAVVGVAVVLASVGVVAMAAVVGVTVVAAMVGATVVAAVAPTVDAAAVPVEPVTTAPPASPMMTGVGVELMDAFTVTSGFAYADGGMNWPVGCAGWAGFGCGPEGLIVPRKCSR